MANNSESNLSSWVDDHLAKLDPQADWRRDVTWARARFDERHAADRAAGRKAAWAVMAVLAGCAGLLAFPAPRGLAQRCVGACESFFLSRAAMSRSPLSQIAPDFRQQDAT